MGQVYLLQSILHPVKQPLHHPPHGVVAEVNNLEGYVAGGEYLCGQQLPAHVPLRELLDVIPGKKILVMDLLLLGSYTKFSNFFVWHELTKLVLIL